MTLFAISELSQAYVDGYKNGQIDRRSGIKSAYAWNCINDLNEYSRGYSQGYRDGWRGIEV